jgi:hypothetical protein
MLVNDVVIHQARSDSQILRHFDKGGEMASIAQMVRTLQKEKEIVQSRLDGINQAIAALSRATGSRQGSVSEGTRRKLRLAWKRRKQRMKMEGTKKG